MLTMDGVVQEVLPNTSSRRDGERREVLAYASARCAAPHPHPRGDKVSARDLAVRPDPRRISFRPRTSARSAAAPRRNFFRKGNSRADRQRPHRLAPARGIAFASAGAITGVAGSPTPLGSPLKQDVDSTADLVDAQHR